MGESEPAAPATSSDVDPSDASDAATETRERPRLIAGAMSGTSGDGVDVAITAITGRGLGMTARLVRHHHIPYDPALKQLLFSIRGAGSSSLADLARLGRQTSLTYARAVNEALAAERLHATDLAAIAAHGQTLYHDPPNTIQWLDPSLLAAETGCAVVSDFRRADLAAGGQGAPLVPFADYLLFRHPTKNRVLLNIGGIANLTYLKAGSSIDEVIAFDTGPGNCISDWICRSRGPFGLSWDVDGAGASRGRVLTDVVDYVLKQPYFGMPPPKSTDAPAMIEGFDAALSAAHAADAPMNDQLATAAHVTAATICLGLERLPKRLDEILATGGGIYNKAIVGWLASMTKVPVRRTQATEAKEAIAFALLAAATLDDEPSNVPSVTGARRRVVLGSITPSPFR
jgi:anhydro-N-acetylmuramic acid kinase